MYIFWWCEGLVKASCEVNSLYGWRERRHGGPPPAGRRWWGEDNFGLDKNEQHCKEKQYYNQVANNLTILQYVFFFLLVLKCNGKSPLLINVSCVIYIIGPLADPLKRAVWCLLDPYHRLAGMAPGAPYGQALSSPGMGGKRFTSDIFLWLVKLGFNTIFSLFGGGRGGAPVKRK